MGSFQEIGENMGGAGALSDEASEEKFSNLSRSQIFLSQLKKINNNFRKYLIRVRKIGKINKQNNVS